MPEILKGEVRLCRILAEFKKRLILPPEQFAYRFRYGIDLPRQLHNDINGTPTLFGMVESFCIAG